MNWCICWTTPVTAGTTSPNSTPFSSFSLKNWGKKKNPPLFRSCQTLQKHCLHALPAGYSSSCCCCCTVETLVSYVPHTFDVITSQVLRHHSGTPFWVRMDVLLTLRKANADLKRDLDLEQKKSAKYLREKVELLSLLCKMWLTILDLARRESNIKRCGNQIEKTRSSGFIQSS